MKRIAIFCLISLFIVTNCVLFYGCSNEPQVSSITYTNANNTKRIVRSHFIGKVSRIVLVTDDDHYYSQRELEEIPIPSSMKNKYYHTSSDVSYSNDARKYGFEIVWKEEKNSRVAGSTWGQYKDYYYSPKYDYYVKVKTIYKIVATHEVKYKTDGNVITITYCDCKADSNTISKISFKTENGILYKYVS